MPDTDTVLRHADANLAAYRDALFELLRIPSISARPEHAPDCRRAGEWVRDALTRLGFAAELRPTAGQPIVLAHHPGP
ncbi:MAG: hypothetical protein KGI51_14345, partial [Rhodospirillales bacterium]|nr:hypothetical protein [Rhodospirillales bacterium]